MIVDYINRLAFSFSGPLRSTHYSFVCGLHRSSFSGVFLCVCGCWGVLSSTTWTVSGAFRTRLPVPICTLGIGDASRRPEMKPIKNTKRELPKHSQPSGFLTLVQAQWTVRFLKSWTLSSKQDDWCVSATSVFRGSNTNRFFCMDPGVILWHHQRVPNKRSAMIGLDAPLWWSVLPHLFWSIEWTRSSHCFAVAGAIPVWICLVCQTQQTN